MLDSPTQYAVLRDHQQWDGVTTANLWKERDGVLTLARLPAPADGRPIVLPGPFDSPPSGVAASPDGELYVADTVNNQIIWQAAACQQNWVLPGHGGVGSGPGQFRQPAGLLVSSGKLYVADRGNRRVQVFSLPSLDLSAIWENGLKEPSDLAADSRGRVYVLDRNLKSVLRFSSSGIPDDTYNRTLSQAGLQMPVFLAVDAHDVLYVSDAQANQIFCFDMDGQALAGLSGGAVWPRALAAGDGRLYAADAEDGRVWVYNLATSHVIGVVAGFRGPVSALAITGEKLYVKPGLDDRILTFQEALVYAASGWLQAGPFDAGEGMDWERVHVDVELPAGTQAELRLFSAASDNQAPTLVDWASDDTLAAALDTLVAIVQSGDRRFLWLRISLYNRDPNASPRLLQIQAETPSQSYLDYLPGVYRRKDSPDHFLERWLALFRSQLGDLEENLDQMFRRFDPMTAPADYLPWLASWLGAELPSGLDEDAQREVLSRLPELYAQRGTPDGLRELVALYSGVRPAIFEAFQERHIWQLGVSSCLGLDTYLPSALPDGMIVPGFTLPDPQYQGLRGDYYRGTKFEQLLLTRTDASVSFMWGTGSPASQIPFDNFSVRWSGQVTPRYSEVYTFSTLSDDGVRLWVDGLLIIDNWTDHAPTTDGGRIALTAGRWYPIVLEFYEKGGGATIQLSWASRSQPLEVVPPEQLYALRDDGLRLPETTADGKNESFEIGQTVVGQSTPLAADEYGLPLFSDEAHLFTVLVPAAAVQKPQRRAALLKAIEAEKPAHTDYHLCLVEANMRVGFQARVGIDSIVAGPQQPMILDGSVLGVETYPGETEGQMDARTGQNARVGQNARLT